MRFPGRKICKESSIIHFLSGHYRRAEINVKDAYDHLEGPEARFKKGDIVLGIVTGFKSDGAPHCEYVSLGKALERLGYRR